MPTRLERIKHNQFYYYSAASQLSFFETKKLILFARANSKNVTKEMHKRTANRHSSIRYELYIFINYLFLFWLIYARFCCVQNIIHRLPFTAGELRLGLEVAVNKSLSNSTFLFFLCARMNLLKSCLLFDNDAIIFFFSNVSETELKRNISARYLSWFYSFFFSVVMPFMVKINKQMTLLPSPDPVTYHNTLRRVRQTNHSYYLFIFR